MAVTKINSVAVGDYSKVLGVAVASFSSNGALNQYKRGAVNGAI